MEKLKFFKKVREVSLTPSQLIAFESNVKNIYESGGIKGVIHLAGNNEDYLIELFSYIDKEDWVFSAWRNHYHAILKKLNTKYIREQIIKGKSMNLNDVNRNFFTSSIVGGVLPIALGVAMSIKIKKQKNSVWVFVGDMTYETGGFHECYKYAKNMKLPIKFIVEDNSMSTNTNTRVAWGGTQTNVKNVIYYRYKRKYPHHGTGKWILF
jgi:pyruvate dehydrogenase E1 component alpha subunit